MAAPVLVPHRHRERLFSSIAVISALVVFVGFARTYYLKELFAIGPLPLLVHIHAAIFTAWIALFFVQARLVAARRTDIHRKLGVAGGLLAALMVTVGLATAINAARHGPSVTSGPPDIPPLVFLVIPLGDIFIFTLLVSAGFLWRRKPEIHKRLMLLATLAILPPAVARIPIALGLPLNPLIFFGIPDLIMFGCIGYDLMTRKRLNPAYLWGGVALLAWQPLRLMLGGTHAWMSFAQWLVR